MKRRAFLSAIGAGSIAAGALVGTGTTTRIEAQRRVKLEVGSVRELTGIRFVAFCGEVATENIDVEVLTVNEDGEPVEIEWWTEDDVDEVILDGDDERYRFHADGARSGTAIMAEEDGGIQLCPDCPSGVEGEGPDSCPGSSCKGETWTKLEFDDGEFGDPEVTNELCSAGSDSDGEEESDAETKSATEPDTDSDSETGSSDETDSSASDADD